MTWQIDNDAAWHKVDACCYRHYSGVTITQKRKLWCAIDLGGNAISSHRTLLNAVASLRRGHLRMIESYEPFTREYGQSRHIVSSVSTTNPMFFVFWALAEDDFPSFVRTALTRYFFGIAKCSSCGAAMKVFQLRKPKWFDGHKESEQSYLACDCGCPVWQMGWDSYEPASIMLEQNRSTWNRKRKLAKAGGKHTRAEIQQILQSQEGRCIYCHRLFTENLVPSKDHLLPLVNGGGDWALNIVLACRSCNSKRNDTPFRTYCTLLSPTQNKRVLMNFVRRLRAIDYDEVDIEAIRCFEVALARHDAKHQRYKSLKGRGDRNVKTRQLLPHTSSGMLRAYEKELRQKLRERHIE